MREKTIQVRVIIALLYFTPFLSAVTPVQLSPSPRLTFFSSTGQLLSGGSVYTYVNGTTTRQATYTDGSGTSQAPNPIALDAAGSASIWIDQTKTYTFKVFDANGVPQYTTDNVNAASFATVQYVAPYTGAVGVPLATYLSGNYIDVRSFCGVAPLADYATCFNAADTAAYQSGVGLLLFPHGTFPICSTVTEKDQVSFEGVARGDAGGQNTVIQACATGFSGSYLISQSDSYNQSMTISRISLNTNNLPGVKALYMNNPNENTIVENLGINALGANATGGIYVNGGGNPGPFRNIYITAGPGANANTVGMVFLGTSGPTRIERSTVDLTGYSSLPNSCIVVSGGSFTFADDHFERCSEVTIGNNTGVNAQNSANSVTGSRFVDCNFGADMVNGVHILAGAIPGLAGQFFSSQNYTFDQNFGPAGKTIVDDNFSYAADSKFRFIGGYPSDTGGTAFYEQFSLATGDSEVFHNPFYFDAAASGTTYPLRIRQPNGRVSIYTGNEGSGVNWQSALDGTGTGFMRGAFCSDAYYVPATLPYWLIPGNGGVDYACLFFGNGGGFGVSTAGSGLVAGQTLSNSLFLTNNTNWYVTGAGHMVTHPTFSGSDVSNDSGEDVQINGPMKVTGAIKVGASATAGYNGKCTSPQTPTFVNGVATGCS